MEAVTSSGTGVTTMAGLAALAASTYGDRPALKHKVGDEWVAVSYEELGTAVSEVGRGLIDLGIAPGERVAILANTRPEWTYANLAILAAGAASVSVYQTNSPEECHYVLEHSESTAVFVEDDEQLAKVRAIRDRLPALEHVVIFDGETGEEALSLADLRERGRGRDQAELDERSAAVTPDDASIFIYTSGTTGPPKGVSLTHGNYRAMCDMVEQTSRAITEGENQVVYLFLPLAHAYALLVQFLALERGSEIAYWQKDPQKIISDLIDVRPTYLPSVPRIFEKIYTLARSNAPDPEKLDQAVEVGTTVRQMRERGEQVPAELQEAFDQADEALFKNVRNLFGGRVEQCVTGAAPIAREILEFFYACGVMVMEGYGMTETSTSASVNTPENFRLGSVGKPFPGVEAKIAEDGELLLRGPNIFRGYYKNDAATRETLVDGWLHTGDLGRIDEDGYIYITGRKKDIIITAGGKNITPANLENGLKQSRWVSHAVVVGDRRPYLIALVALDPEELPAFAQEHGIAVEDVPSSDAMRAEIQTTVDEVNSHYGRVEQIKKFAILPHDLSQATGELTPTMKVKRNVVYEKFAGVVEAVYSG